MIYILFVLFMAHVWPIILRALEEIAEISIMLLGIALILRAVGIKVQRPTGTVRRGISAVLTRILTDSFLLIRWSYRTIRRILIIVFIWTRTKLTERGLKPLVCNILAAITALAVIAIVI